MLKPLSLSIAILLVSILVSVSACKEPNPYYCETPESCRPLPEPCGASECGAQTPVCKSEDPLVCVECTSEAHCVSAVPHCDPAANVCVECLMDGHCPTGICLPDRACVGAEEVAYVAMGGTDAGDCPEMAPCATLEFALKLPRQPRYIKVRGKISTGPGHKIERPVTLLGEAGAVLARSMNGVVLEIKKQAVASLFDLGIEGGTPTGDGVLIREGASVTMTRVSSYKHKGDGIVVESGLLVMNDSSVSDNTGSGISVMDRLTMNDSKAFKNLFGVNVMGGTATVNHSWIYENTGTGLSSTAMSTVTLESSVISKNTGTYGLALIGTIAVRNSIISSNGRLPPATTTTMAGVLLSAANGPFEFNTVSDNITTGPNNLGISCASSHAISNSILSGNTVVGCMVERSLTDSPVLPGTGNDIGLPMFMDTANPLAPKFYRIGATSAARNKAAAGSGVKKDIDGEDRDADPDMGADEYH